LSCSALSPPSRRTSSATVDSASSPRSSHGRRPLLLPLHSYSSSPTSSAFLLTCGSCLQPPPLLLPHGAAVGKRQFVSPLLMRRSAAEAGQPAWLGEARLEWPRCGEWPARPVLRSRACVRRSSRLRPAARPDRARRAGDRCVPATAPSRASLLRGSARPVRPDYSGEQGFTTVEPGWWWRGAVARWEARQWLLLLRSSLPWRPGGQFGALRCHGGDRARPRR